LGLAGLPGLTSRWPGWRPAGGIQRGNPGNERLTDLLTVHFGFGIATMLLGIIQASANLGKAAGRSCTP